MRSLARSIRKFSADDMFVYAAALSYQLFFSLFPFVIFLLALLGVLNLTGFFDWLIKQSQTVLPGQASGLVKDIVSQIRGQGASGALSLGAVLALWSASSAVRMAMHALNVAYEVEDRAVWKKFPLSILYTVLPSGPIVYLAGARTAGRTFVQAALDWQVVVVAEVVLILVGLMSAFS